MSFMILNKWLNFRNVQLPSAGMKGSDRTDMDRTVTIDLKPSGSRPTGAREARLIFFNIYFFTLKQWTTETSLCSIKYCYFSTSDVYFVIQLLE